MLFSANFIQGCAFANSKNRRALNLLDQHISPESTGSQIAAAPFVIPVSTTAAVADLALIHPLCSIPEAADDTYRVLWENPRGSDFRNAMLILPKAATTPIFFVGDLTARCLFDIR